MAFGAVKSLSQPKRLLNISSYDTSGNQQGIPVPYFAGAAKLPLTWINRPYNVTVKKVSSTSGGKASSKAGTSGTTQKKYRGDICGVACVCYDDATVDSLILLLVNDEIAFQGPLNRTPGQHYAAFSLQKYCQDCRIWWGTKDSPFDNHILLARTVPIGGGDANDPSTFPIDSSSGGTVLGGQFVAGVPDAQAGHYDTHPAYRNQCRFTFRQFHFGSTMNMPNIEVILVRGCKFFSINIAADATLGINPAGPAYEIYTDDLFGAGMPAAKLDEASFQGVKDNCDAQSIAIAPVVDRATSLRSFVADLIQYYNGWFRTKAGTLEAGMFLTGNIPTGGLTVLGDDDLASEPKLNPGSLDDTKNYFSIVFTAGDNYFYRDDVRGRYVDDANFQKVGERRPEQVQRPFFINPAIAIRYIAAYGIIAAQEPQQGTLQCLRESVANLKPGDLFKLNSGSYSQTLLLRVLKRKRSASNKGTVELSVEREPGTWPALFDQSGIPKPGDFRFHAAPIAYYRIVELPQGLRDNINVVEIAILALRPNAITIGFNVLLSTDGGATYEKIATVNHFSVFGRVVTATYPASTANPDVTTGLQANLWGYDQDQVAAQDDQARDNDTLLNFIESEIGSVGDVNALGSGVFKIFGRRAQYNTLAAAHVVGTDCWFVLRADLLPIPHTAFVPGSSVKFKLQSFTELEDYDVSLAAAIDYTFNDQPTYAAPSISPAGGSFAGSVDVSIAADPALVLRYRIDGVATIDSTCPEWPKASGAYTTLHVDHSCTLAVGGLINGVLMTDVTVATFTAVVAGAPATPTCGVISFSFTGTKNSTGGTLTMRCATPSSTIKYKKNGGALTTYSTGLALVSNATGDVVVAHGEASGYLNSPDSTFDNTYTPPEGRERGGGGGGGHLPP